MNPILALVIANLIWGAASPIFKLSLQNIPPFTLAFLRFAIASVILFPFAFSHTKKLDWTTIGELCIVGFFGVTVNIAFYFMGLQNTQSINAPIISSSQPLFLYLFSIILLHEKANKKILFGLIISFIGVCVIIFSPFLRDSQTTILDQMNAFKGNLFLIIASMGSLAQTLLVKRLSKRVSWLPLTYVCFVFGAVSFLPFLQMEFKSWSFALLDIRGIMGILFGSIFSSSIAYSMFHYGISHVKAQEVGIFTYIDPIVGILLAMPLLGEYPNWFFIVGSTLVFIGIFLAENRIHYFPLQKMYEMLSIKTKTSISNI